MDFKLAPGTPESEEAQFIFENLPWQQFIELPVVDVGSHYGGFSLNFLNAGFKVESFEPNPENFQKQAANLQKFLHSEQLNIHQIAASNKDGEALMYLSTADTLHSLCPEWRSIAFPEYFNTDNQITVQCRKLGKFLRERGCTSLFFVKVDTEGHEYETISGLIDDGEHSLFPYVLMFEVNKRFQDKIADVLRLLVAKGYKNFVWWIKYNEKILYHAIHVDDKIPDLSRIDDYYYGNIIALLNPFEDFILSTGKDHEKAQEADTFKESTFEELWNEMRQEYENLNAYLRLSDYVKLEPEYIHPSWLSAKEQIRKLLLGQPNSRILDEPVIGGKMVRHGFTVSQEYEVTFLKFCIRAQTKDLLARFQDTDFGELSRECQEFNCSTNTLGHLYYAAKILEKFADQPLKQVVEFGGGYGNLARIFKILIPDTTIMLIDLPELLALQYLFLRSTLPDINILFHHAPPENIQPTAIHLIPVFFLDQINCKTDLFISTFALSETTRAVQGTVVKKHFFNSIMTYIAGQLEGASPEDNWHSHQLIFDSMRELYQLIDCQPFHVFQHGVTLYEILGSNPMTLKKENNSISASSPEDIKTPYNLNQVSDKRLQLVSIFIPVYNSEKYLAETLDSLINQTFNDFEIIIADDGSTNKSLEIARKYEQMDSRIKVLALPHRGEVSTRNEAIRHTTPNSKYLLNHDSDDISLPTKLERLVEYLETHPEISIVGCFAEYFDDEGNYKGKPPIEWESERIRETFGEINSMINSAALIRREVFEKIGAYREEFRSVDDYDFFTRALISGFELANIPEILHKIRLHPKSIGSTRSQLQNELARKIQQNYKKHRDVESVSKNKNFTTKINSKHLRLHLGCGNIKIPGFINVDIDPKLQAVDVVDNVKELNNFTENSTSLIYACHILEHFANDEILPILRRWYEVLEPGGELRISVPDMDRIVKVYYKNWKHFQTPPNTPWIGLIYGGQEDQYDFHKTGFNFTYLKYLLEQAGFVEIEEYPHTPHWLGIQDASLANEPFKEYISLNIKAKKPQPSLNIEKSRKVSLSILHTVEFYSPHIGGAEIVVQQVSERLAKRGHRVEVATTKLPERNFKELNGVTIHEFDVAGNLAVGVRGSDFHRYQEFLINHPANVMMNYAAQQWATDVAFFALEATQNKRVNVIAPCGYSALEDARTLRWPQFADYFGKIIPVVIPYYDAAIYHSSMYKDYEFAQLHGFQNSIVIPNGVDEEEFSQQTSVSFREKYGITTPYMGLCVANYYRDKGHDRIIEAVRQMNRKDFTMVFIGKDGDELQSLKKQSADLNIKFLVNIPREDTVAAFHEADIFLFGSSIEASPLVIIEAKASKTPFVSTDCGNVREWKGGIVCSPEEMAENANKLLNDESQRKQLAEEGYREWKEKLTWETVVDKYEELYLRLYHAKRKQENRNTFISSFETKADEKVIPPHPPLEKGGNLDLKMGEEGFSLEEEEHKLREKLKKDFRNVEVLIRLAEIELERSNLKKARNYIIAALSLEPQNVAAKTLLEKLSQ